MSLALCLAGLATLTAAALTGHRWPFHWRLPLVVIAPWLALAAFQLAQPPTGWPARVAVPGRSQATFVWGVVREPDPSTNDKGEIDLWLTPPGSDQPRAFRLPYTRQLHKQVLQAEAGVKHGAKIAVARPSGRARAGHSTSHSRQGIRFYQLPPAQLPTKQ